MDYSNWCALSSVIDVEEIWRNLDLPWDVECLSYNKGVTVDLMRQFPGNWNIRYVSGNIRMEEIRQYPNEGWNLYGLSFNPNLTADVVLMFGINDTKWNWSIINRNMHIDEIRKLSKHGGTWDKQEMSYNKSITWGFVDENIGTGTWSYDLIAQYMHVNEIKKYDTDGLDPADLSKNDTIDLELIKMIPDGNWIWGYIYYRLGIDDLLKMYRDVGFNDDDYKVIKYNPHITLDLVMMCDDYDSWDWDHITRIVNPYEYYMNPDLPWTNDGMCGNPRITIRDIEWFFNDPDEAPNRIYDYEPDLGMEIQ